MRRWLNFTAEGAQCAATLDPAAGQHGLLIVSGGNETRAGAHRGMARLAALVAAAGHPVLRFDRRGVGDSEGTNGGFESSGPDIAAALTLFRQYCPQLTRITAFGNCDAATALILHAPEGVDALLLANPWSIDAASGEAENSDAGDAATLPSLPPAAAIRARYLAKLRDPREWGRLLRGGVNLGKLLRGLRAASAGAPASDETSLAARMAQALTDQPPGRAVSILIASGDGTAQAFMAEWGSKGFAALRDREEIALHHCPTSSHSFADDAAREWLEQQVLAALSR